MSKNIISDWIKRLKKGRMLSIIVTLFIIIGILGVIIYIKSREYRQLTENGYNQAFYQLVEYVNTTEKLLKKATITNSSSEGAKILTSAWKSSNLAQSCLAQIPIKTQELENTNKFLSQTSDYCYSISKKNFKGEKISKEDWNNLNNMHEYALELENVLNALETDLYSGNIKWGELSKKGNEAFKDDLNNLSKNSFSNIEEELHQYTGLIYDGAYSENQNFFKGIGLVGKEIDETSAQEKVKEFLGKENIIDLNFTGENENARVNCYTYNGKEKNGSDFEIAITKKGGHVLFYNLNRDVNEKSIDEQKAISLGKKFLDNKKFNNMKETYYMNEGNILTINYAYMQDDVIVYPDLVKVKVAMDNGEIMGMESTNYLNNHQEKRNLVEAKLTENEAKEKINNNVIIKAVDKAIIPTEWNTEINCYEIKGEIKDKNESNDCLIYINMETGEEEDILMIVNTPNGTLTT